MTKLVFVAILAAAAGCGDDHPTLTTDAPGGGGDSGTDAGPPTGGTLTAYVIDLVNNHTSATEMARPFSEFATLPDPDGDNNNTAAYASLFP